MNIEMYNFLANKNLIRFKLNQKSETKSSESFSYFFENMFCFFIYLKDLVRTFENCIEIQDYNLLRNGISFLIKVEYSIHKCHLKYSK